LEVSYPFHFSTKHLIETFNDNPGFQKTRDVIRLMAAIVRSIWSKGTHEVDRHTLLSLASPDLNESAVASRFKEIKRSLEGALQTDIANAGTSYAESLEADTGGLSLITAKWIYAASLSETRPRGLSKEELAEYLAAPGVDLTGLGHTLDELQRNCWYLEQYRSGKIFFNKVKNLNAQLNTYVKTCSDLDRDGVIEDQLKQMFDPKQKRCYQRIFIHPDLSKVTLERDKITLVICGHESPYQKFFDGEKYKNRVTFLTVVDPAGLVRIRNHARRQWAIEQVLKDMSRDDAQYEKAKDERTNIQSELFLAIRSVYARLLYPLGDPSTGDSKLTDTTLLDSYVEEPGGQSIKYDGIKKGDGKKDEAKDNTTKGELVVETTLGSVKKFHVIPPATGADKVKAYKSIRTRVEQFLFPSSGRAAWDQILDAAGSRGLMVWAEPGTLDRMKDVLITAGEWRDQAGQVMKPPFEEVTGISIEHARDAKTGRITTTDIKLHNADTLYVTEDTAKPRKIKHDDAFSSDAMVLVFTAKDSTGKNKEGKPYRIENQIDLKHDFLPSATPGHRTLKLGVVPPDAKVKWTADKTDPANNGAAYPAKGVDVKEGATVKVYAEKASAHAEIAIQVPKEDEDTGGKGKTGPALDPNKPAILAGKALQEMALVSRMNVHGFLSKLPAGATLAGARAKVVKAETDNRVSVAWDGKTRLTADRLIKAFEFLDKELTDAEWELDASSLTFPTGKALIEWQKEISLKIAPGLITQ
jgi:hypothetical protein